jgi:type IV pilus assembly protein PilM
MLRQIPPFVQTPDIGKLIDHAEELQWLIDDLKHQPSVTQTLQEIADRLIKAAPTHAEAPKLKQQIVERLAKEAPADPRQRYHHWSAAPKKTYVDWPIDWLTGCKNFRFAEPAHQQLFQDHPGRFFVALGLALQGLGKAPLDLNFVPEDKKFSLKQFSTFMRKRADRFAWGIDLNAFGLKAVKLERNEKDGAITVVDAVFLKHRKLLSQPDAEMERGALCGDTAKEFLAARTLGDARIVANIPSHRMLGRFFDLPAIELKKVPDAVEYETRHQLPYALTELIWDWSLVSSRELAEHEDTRRVVVVAGRDFYVNERIASLKELNLSPHVLTSDSIALHNFLLHEFFTGETNVSEVSHDAVVLLDVGTEGTNMVITSPSVHWCRSLPVGGDHFTEPLIKQFKLTYSQAELLKREPFRARRMLPLYETFDPLFEELASEINRSLDTFQQLYPDQTLSRIYGSGGGFPLHGLWKRLRSGK